MLVKSDANDWSDRMQMGEQVCAITQVVDVDLAKRFFGPLIAEKRAGISAATCSSGC